MGVRGGGLSNGVVRGELSVGGWGGVLKMVLEGESILAREKCGVGCVV